MTKSDNIALVKQVLQCTFPVDPSKPQLFKFYPTSNEYGFKEVFVSLDQLPTSMSTSVDETIRVALLFGESNFLSMLPKLTKFADVVLLADIEPLIHLHNEYILRTFMSANSPEEFLQTYIRENPFPEVYEDSRDEPLILKEDTETMFGKTSIPSFSLKEHHFLASQETYDECKKAAGFLQASIIHIDFDLFDSHSCEKMNELFLCHNAKFTLCNFTNIHQYRRPRENRTLDKTLPLLLRGSYDSIIMHSSLGGGPDKSSLETALYMGIEDFAQKILKTNLTREHYQFFSSKTSDSYGQQHGLIASTYGLNDSSGANATYG